jgi:hypothetical protein
MDGIEDRMFPPDGIFRVPVSHRSNGQNAGNEKRRGLLRAVFGCQQNQCVLSPNNLRRNATKNLPAASAAESTPHLHGAARPNGRPSTDTGCCATSSTRGPKHDWWTGAGTESPIAPPEAPASRQSNCHPPDSARRSWSVVAGQLPPLARAWNTPWLPAEPLQEAEAAELKQRLKPVLKRNRRTDQSRHRPRRAHPFSSNRRGGRKYTFSYPVADSGFAPWFAHGPSAAPGLLPHV